MPSQGNIYFLQITILDEPLGIHLHTRENSINKYINKYIEPHIIITTRPLKVQSPNNREI